MAGEWVRACRWPSDGSVETSRDELEGVKARYFPSICISWIVVFQFGSQVRSCSLSIAYRQPYQIAPDFFFFFACCSTRVCFASKLLRFSDYPQGSAGLHMKAYSSASHSTVIVSIGLESLVNTKQERDLFRLGILPCLLQLLNPTPSSAQPYRATSPGQPPQIGWSSHQLHLGLIVHSETPPRVWVRHHWTLAIPLGPPGAISS